MSDIAISVESLSKAYRIGLKEEIPDSLMVAAVGWVKAPLRNLQRLRRLNTFNMASNSSAQAEEDDIIWALKDVSFEVQRGEVVGIIGGNGAGKSTLLKILSRITEPTAGRAVIQGHVSSLLEVGTGFHPELTGRENIYMNGTILGMTKREIDHNFEEIVEFAGVGRFLDTPVKRYSSGMKVRLAFAVAAHLEPEILIIDEVLAVGDEEFQKKCMGKMREVAKGGRTVLFVSHNMAAIRALCDSAAMLENGTLALRGAVDSTVDSYLSRATSTFDESNADGSVSSRTFKVYSVTAKSCDHDHIRTYDTVDIMLEFSARRQIETPSVYFSVFSPDGTRLSALETRNFSRLPPIQPDTPTTLGFRVTNFPLLPGRYTIQVYLKDLFDGLTEEIPSRFPLYVADDTVNGLNRVTHWQGHLGLAATLIEPRS